MNCPYYQQRKAGEALEIKLHCHPLELRVSGRDRPQIKQFPPVWQEEHKEITKAGGSITNLLLFSCEPGEEHIEEQDRCCLPALTRLPLCVGLGRGPAHTRLTFIAGPVYNVIPFTTKQFDHHFHFLTCHLLY